MFRGGLGFAALALSLALPSAAQAHADLPQMGSFWSGVVHFLLSLDRLGLTFALALWSSAQTPRADAAVVACVGAGAFGAALVRGSFPALGDIPDLTALVMALVGVAAAARQGIARQPMLLIAAFCGFIVGAIGAMGDTFEQRALNAAGLALATAAVAAYTLMGASFALSSRNIALALRLGAGLVAGSGGVLLCIQWVSRA
jgi:hydrogenase/urease accessory protein HupE